MRVQGGGKLRTAEAGEGGNQFNSIQIHFILSLFLADSFFESWTLDILFLGQIGVTVRQMWLGLLLSQLLIR